MALATRRRSLHFVPGGNERMIAKALTLPADGLILDLEDAVAPDLKEATRPIVTRWLTEHAQGPAGLPLLIERARLLAAEGRWDDAARDLETFFKRDDARAVDYADRKILRSDVDHLDRAVDAWSGVDGLHVFVGDVGR